MAMHAKKTYTMIKPTRFYIVKPATRNCEKRIAII